MAIQAEACSSAEDYERVCERERIINKKQYNTQGCCATDYILRSLKVSDDGATR
jgi:hypothetical protein